MDELQDILNISFFSAAQLQREWNISEKLRRLIVSQPGYRRGEEMAVAKTKSGGFRLYVRVNQVWMDASLQDFPI